MSIIRTLDALIAIHTRAAGNTTAAIKVAKETGAIIVVIDHNQKTYIERMARDLGFFPIGLLTLDELSRSSGFERPIIVDHHAFEHLIRKMRYEIDQRDSMIKELQKTISELENTASPLETSRKARLVRRSFRVNQ